MDALAHGWADSLGFTRGYVVKWLVERNLTASAFTDANLSGMSKSEIASGVIGMPGNELENKIIASAKPESFITKD